MENYRLNKNEYIISNYDRLPPFSSFLPGLTGADGIPMWVFYTNRGQGISSFGIHNKNDAIMEFFPANAAYENTSLKGFRTFMRLNGKYYEPFSTNDKSSIRTLSIRKNSFSIAEECGANNISMHVNYFVMPGEPLGALARRVSVENTGADDMNIEIIDGLPKIIPYGIGNGAFKELSNLFKSWTEIRNTEKNIPFYTMRASTDDSAEVSEIKGGYFYMTECNNMLKQVICDSDCVFGYDTSMSNPMNFIENGLAGVTAITQSLVNKVPCGFAPFSCTLKPGEKITWTTYIGFAEREELINNKSIDWTGEEFAQKKEKLADSIVEQLMEDVRTETSMPVFDKYIEQCYLDNFIRGGYPFVTGSDKKTVMYLFSRKHGDPERDYNFFVIDGGYYSQGNGNFRDVCQNRRNDVMFCPGIGDHNIRYFFSLIQADGYNPLEIRPETFSIAEENRMKVIKIIERAVDCKLGTHEIDRLNKLISRSFKAGELFNVINNCTGKQVEAPEKLLEELLVICTQNFEAGFGEGYWSDHWDYLMDLIDNYLMVYPDKKAELLYKTDDYRFYNSIAIVLPRSETYVYNHSKVWQLGSMYRDDKKKEINGFEPDGTNWLKTSDDDVFTTTLFVKMISLCLNKIASLDSYGMGVEMEGGKPGWNDAMNGLPGLFGSSVPEMLELKRMVDFIRNESENQPGRTIKMPREIAEFLRKLVALIENSDISTRQNEMTYWDLAASLREEYREMIKYTISGICEEVSEAEIHKAFLCFSKKIDRGIERALSYGKGVIPTYFTYNPVKYSFINDSTGEAAVNAQGLKRVRVEEFEVVECPHFLEGPARYLGQAHKEAKDMYEAIRKSGLYDNKLHMYKTSESIENLSMQYGRIRAFTPGWLERESIFLHMEYKYLLAMLRAGLYDEFFDDMKSAMIPFMKPGIYGRSNLENSSFIASSSNPDPTVHGRGFVARLSGSTTEVLSMFITMFLGNKGFYCENGILKLKFEPVLPGWMFDSNADITWTLLGHCRVQYHNEEKNNTYGSDGAKVVRMVLTKGKNETVIEGNILTGETAEAVREGKYDSIRAELI